MEEFERGRIEKPTLRNFFADLSHERVEFFAVVVLKGENLFRIRRVLKSKVFLCTFFPRSVFHC